MNDKFSGGLLAIGSQLLSSGATFILSISIINSSGDAGFGLFTIIFSCSIFISGLNSSFITTRAALRLRIYKNEYKYFRFINFSFCKLLYLILFEVIFLIVLFVISLFFVKDIYLNALFVLLSLCVTSTGKDFYNRIFFDKKMEVDLFLTNLISFFSMLGLLVILFLFENKKWELQAYAFVFSQLMFCIISLYIFKTKLIFLKIKRFYKKNISRSLHIANAHIFSSLRAQGYLYVVALIRGAEMVGALSAARLVATPALMIIPPLTQRNFPEYASMYVNKDLKGLEIEYKLNERKIFLFNFVYAVIVILVYFLYKKWYSNEGHFDFLILLWLLFSCISSQRSLQENILVATKKFNHQSFVSMLSVGVSIIIIPISCFYFNVIEVLTGFVFSEFLSLLAGYFFVKKIFQE
jgi:O-antigen/teichoic acid export membrane protein